MHAEPYSPGWSKNPFIVKNDYFSVTASMNPRQSCTDSSEGWIVPSPVRSLTKVSPQEDEDAWAARSQAVPYSGAKLKFTIQGLNGRTVIITHFGVLVVKREAPLVGSITKFYADCGGVTHSYFEADLDKASDDLTLEPVQGDGIEEVEPVVPLPHSVSESDPEQWIVTLDTSTCHCSVVPYFDYTSDGVASRFEIKLGVRPWEVSAAAPGSNQVVQGGADYHTWTIGG